MLVHRVFDQMLAPLMTSCLNHSPLLARFYLLLGGNSRVSPQGKAHNHSRPYVRTIEIFRSDFVIQLGHTIVSSVQKASSARSCNAAFPKAPSGIDRSPRLLVKMFLTPPEELIITATLVGAICSGSSSYEQALDRYLGHAHMILHIDTHAHTNHAATFRRMKQDSRPFSLRPIMLVARGKDF